MSTTNTSIQSSTTIQRGKVAWGRLWLLGLLAVIASVIVNFLIALLARNLLAISPSFIQLQTPAVVSFTIFGTIGAVLVFALINRLSSTPIRLYRIIATVVLVITLIPDLLLLSTPGATVPAIAALMVMHLATYLVCVGLLTSVAPAK